MKQILCYGDSNTWGLIPGTENRYPWGVRWTSILQEMLNPSGVRIVEEGLCGRTTVFEDSYREKRNGWKELITILESQKPLDGAVLMLGTNDCKSYYKANAYQIAKGLERCVDRLEEYIPSENILVVAPIHLGEQVWKQEFDPEFDQESVRVSKELYAEYQKVAERKKVHFLAASDVAKPSEVDQEHLTVEGHAALANAIFRKLS